MAASLAQMTQSRPAARLRADHPLAAESSQVSDGAVIERLVRMRTACQALALELAGTRRELKSVQTELRRLKRRHGED
jgi:hypothetical protein